MILAFHYSDYLIPISKRILTAQYQKCKALAGLCTRNRYTMALYKTNGTIGNRRQNFCSRDRAYETNLAALMTSKGDSGLVGKDTYGLLKITTSSYLESRQSLRG